jgi:hypothetical protein
MRVCGAVVSSGGGVVEVSTANERVAAVGSVLPDASVARAATVWGPSASGSVVKGVVQGAKPPSSTLH